MDPDRFDVIGAMVCLVGVVMMYWRGEGEEEETGMGFPCTRATRGGRLPSLDARM